MSARSMLRAAAAPERFLDRGFARVLARGGAAPATGGVDLGVVLPPDLARFMEVLAGRSIGQLSPRPSLPKLAALLSQARRGGAGLARLVALLAGAVPIGDARGEVIVYFLAEAPAAGLVAAIAPEGAPRLVCRGAAELAVLCAQEDAGDEPEPARFGILEEEHVRARTARARALAAALTEGDAELRAALRALAPKPLDVPPTTTRAASRRARTARTAPLALGALFELFLRDGDPRSALEAHASSADRLVQEASALLIAALDGAPRSDLARRRALALRTMRAAQPARQPGSSPAIDLTNRIVARFDALPPNAESFGATQEREETLFALATLGDRAVAPALLARALAGDAGAVDMLAALGDRSIVPHLVGLLGGQPSRARTYEAAIVRTLVAVRAREAVPALATLLRENPLTGWREGLERAGLVRELVIGLGELGDAAAADDLLAVLHASSQEYRTVLPLAAQALGRLRHVPALPGLERLLFSPKEPVSCEVVWAVGAIGQAHEDARERAADLLDRVTGLPPGPEVTRLAALAKMRGGKSAPRLADLVRALERALREPAFRQEETSRQRAWGLRALEELAPILRRGRAAAASLVPDHDTIRWLVTRDDHRVRTAAAAALAAWGVPVPAVRPYFAYVLADLEHEGGLDALLEAVRDPLGIFRHNVAERLAEIGDPRAVRPLAEATARMFAEPPTSTYEYDDAPPRLVAFVRALARLNQPEGNDVLVEGLRSGNHQVRAVVAESAPADPRIVPELMAMLGDARSFLRSRAEKSLIALGAIPPPLDPGTTEVAIVPRPAFGAVHRRDGAG